MLNLLILIGRGLALAFRGHHELVLENLALRQQLVAATRTARRPRLVASDRRRKIGLARRVQDWTAPRTGSLIDSADVRPNPQISRLGIP